MIALLHIRVSSLGFRRTEWAPALKFTFSMFVCVSRGVPARHLDRRQRAKNAETHLSAASCIRAENRLNCASLVKVETEFSKNVVIDAKASSSAP